MSAGRHPSVQRAGEHPDRQLGLGRERHVLGHCGLLAPWPVLGPGLGQVQLPVKERATGRAGIAQEHPDLAVLDPARGAGVLPGHPRRSAALLQKPGLVDHQHRLRIAQVLHHVVAQVVTDPVRVPVRRCQQPLHPVRAGLTGQLGQRPAVPALQRRQQATQIRHHPLARL